MFSLHDSKLPQAGRILKVLNSYHTPERIYLLTYNFLFTTCEFQDSGGTDNDLRIAKDVHLCHADRSHIKLDIGESHSDEGNQSTPLCRAQDATQYYDYVLVYERCQREEEKDDQCKKRAENLEKMRNQFEESLKRADLKLTKLDPVPTTRQLVRSPPFLVAIRYFFPKLSDICTSFLCHPYFP